MPTNSIKGCAMILFYCYMAIKIGKGSLKGESRLDCQVHIESKSHLVHQFECILRYKLKLMEMYL